MPQKELYKYNYKKGEVIFKYCRGLTTITETFDDKIISQGMVMGKLATFTDDPKDVSVLAIQKDKHSIKNYLDFSIGDLVYTKTYKTFGTAKNVLLGKGAGGCSIIVEINVEGKILYDFSFFVSKVEMKNDDLKRRFLLNDKVFYKKKECIIIGYIISFPLYIIWDYMAGNDTFYVADSRSLKPKTLYITRKKCSICGKFFESRKVSKGSNGFYVCPHCLKNKKYSTKNKELFHKKSKKGLTYSFELECVPRSYDDKAFMLKPEYKLIPTKDASLPYNGVEFKTPIYQSLVGIKQLLTTFEKHVDFRNKNCGQHINIGHEILDSWDIVVLFSDFSSVLLKPLREYFSENKDITIKLFGRYFNYYAKNEDKYEEHLNWIKIHKGRFEFRLAKFNDVEQYYKCIKFCAKIVEVIVKDFVKPIKSNHSHIVSFIKTHPAEIQNLSHSVSLTLSALPLSLDI